MPAFGSKEALCPCAVVVGEWWDGSLIGVGSEKGRGEWEQRGQAALLRHSTMKERKEVGQWLPTFWKLSYVVPSAYQLSGKSYFCRNLVITIQIFFPLS